MTERKLVMPIGEPIVVGNKVSEKWAAYFQLMAEMSEKPVIIQIGPKDGPKKKKNA